MAGFTYDDTMKAVTDAMMRVIDQGHPPLEVARALVTVGCVGFTKFAAHPRAVEFLEAAVGNMQSILGQLNVALRGDKPTH